MGSPAPGLPTVDVADRLRWLGHSTVFVELDGTRLLTDPLLRRRVFHLQRAHPLQPEDQGELAAGDPVEAWLLDEAAP